MPNPEMTPVTSSNIDSVGHDADANELHVRFKNGATHIYEGVSDEIHRQMVAAESVGKFLASNVKGVFNSRKKD